MHECARVCVCVCEKKINEEIEEISTNAFIWFKENLIIAFASICWFYWVFEYYMSFAWFCPTRHQSVHVCSIFERIQLVIAMKIINMRREQRHVWRHSFCAFFFCWKIKSIGVYDGQLLHLIFVRSTIVSLSSASASVSVLLYLHLSMHLFR